MEESDPFLQHDPWHLVDRPGRQQPPRENNENEPVEEQIYEAPVDSSSSTEQTSDTERDQQRADRSRLQELLAAQSSSSFSNASQQGFRSAETRERLLREQVSNTSTNTISLGTPPRGTAAVLPSWITSGYLRQHTNPQEQITFTREEPEEEQPRPQSSSSSSGDFNDNPQ